ncbi:MAG: TM2 domain-containing protein [Paludibacteraceae bacterium]|nr:TM2 domain-containing protein [Paludibacteraceae bacterium]
MDQAKIEAYLAKNAGMLPEEKVAELKAALAKINDDQMISIEAIKLKDPKVALLLAIFLGGYGVDRFYLGQAGLGVLKLLTCGGCSIWAIIDWFSAKNRAKEFNFGKIKEALAAQGIA